MKNYIIFFLIFLMVMLVTHMIIYGEGFSLRLFLTAAVSSFISTLLFWVLTGLMRKKK
jgi:ABC-type Na+ efflux pump permease subunit